MGRVAALWAGWKAGLRNLPSPLPPAGTPVTYNFPTEPLTVFAELALGADLDADPASWSFTDATDFFYTRDGATITRGRQDYGTVADPWALTCTVNNRDGRWSTRNPVGAWYGQLHLGTPIRWSVQGRKRFAGFASALPPRWDVSGNDRYAPLEAKGWLYLLSRGAKPARSAINRTVLSLNPLAYWSLERALTTSLALPRTATTSAPTTIIATSGVSEGTGSSPTGSAGAAIMGPSDNFTGTVSMAANPTAWTVVFWVYCELVSPFVGPPVADLVSFSWTTPLSNANYTWIITSTTDGAGFAESALNVADSTGTLGPVAPGVVDTDLMDGNWHMVAVTATQVGADIAVTFRVDSEVDTDTAVAATLEPVTAVRGGNLTVGSAEDNVSTIGIAHVAVFNTALSTAVLDGLYQATGGYNGEQAHVRHLRLCAEENIPAQTGATQSQAMGPQGVGTQGGDSTTAPGLAPEGTKTLLQLLRECEASDQGFLFETPDFGLYFQGHAERFNMAAALALDYETAGHIAPPLEPTDDDQGTVNYAEVAGSTGADYRVFENDPNAELSIPNIGRRDDSQTYSLYSDDQPKHLAGWRLHMGTYPGYRFPTVTLNLAAAPELIDDLCDAGLAFRATIDNPPDDIGPDQISLIVEGYSETFGHPIDWDFTANCSLELPWRVHVVEGAGNLGRVDLNDSTLAAAITDPAATSFTVAVPTVLWVTGSGLAIDFVIGGERMTVDTITGASSPQTFSGVTRSVNGAVKTHLVSTPVRLFQPGVYGF